MSDSPKKNYDVEIIFKSGAKTTVNLEEFTVNKNGLGGVHSMESKSGRDAILRLDIDEIAAVIVR